MQNKDILWKSILEDLFPDFLRFIHPGVDEILDLDKKPEFLNPEFKVIAASDDKKPSSIQVDKLAKVYSIDGKEELIILHFEVQDQYSPNFAARMFRYYYHIMESYPGKRISAYAIFTESATKLRPDVYSTSFMGTTMDYKFNTYKIAGPTDEELLASGNPFAMVVRTARTIYKGQKIKDKAGRNNLLKDLKLALIKELYTKGYTHKKTRSLFDFISNYISFDSVEIKHIFDKELHIFHKTHKNMGIREAILLMEREEGIEIGREEGKEIARKEGKEIARKEVENKLKKLAYNFIHNLKFTEELTAELLDVPLDFVRKNIAANS